MSFSSPLVRIFLSIEVHFHFLEASSARFIYLYMYYAKGVFTDHVTSEASHGICEIPPTRTKRSEATLQFCERSEPLFCLIGNDRIIEIPLGPLRSEGARLLVPEKGLKI